MLLDGDPERLEPCSPHDSSGKITTVPTASGDSPAVAPTKRALKPSRVSALKPAMKTKAVRSQQHVQSLFARDAHGESPQAATASNGETRSSQPSSGQPLWVHSFRAASSGAVAPCVTATGMAPPPLLLSSNRFDRPLTPASERRSASQEAVETVARGANNLRHEVRRLSKEVSAMRTIRSPCLSPLNSPPTSPSLTPKLLAPSLVGRFESLAVDGSDDASRRGKRAKRVGLKPTRIKLKEVQRLGPSNEAAPSHTHQPAPRRSRKADSRKA